MRQFEFAKYKRNDWERLNEEYPELKQMPVNNHGYDWVIYNEKGTPVKVEEKFRSTGVKVDITPTQADPRLGFDIIVLRDSLDIFYCMHRETYMQISKPHSALASGWEGKILEASQSEFIDNSTLDLRSLAEEVEHSFGTLEAFFG